MLIKTKDYGSIEIDENDIISFKQGLYGFEQTNRYVVLGQDGEGIMQLQAADDTDSRFIILDPFMFVKDYNPALPVEIYSLLKAEECGELCIFNIAVIPDNIKDITVNLRSPIIINFTKRLGAQVILDDDYSMRYKLFSSDGGELC